MARVGNAVGVLPTPPSSLSLAYTHTRLLFDEGITHGIAAVADAVWAFSNCRPAPKRDEGGACQ
jgi:hypothetical protein